MAVVRKNQASLSDAEWELLIDAIDQLHGVRAARPAYRDYVALHVDAMISAQGMAWGVHTMRNMNMVGRNFLAWHRRFILSFEQRLQKVHPEVSLPYWDWVKNRELPAALDDRRLLRRWSVQRGRFDAAQLPTSGMVRQVLALSPYAAFQSALEAIHGPVHIAVGGDMGGSRSPNDPLFFLHHANVDRLWSQWAASPNSAEPPNAAETLQPRGDTMSGRVRDVMKIDALGYAYR